MLQVTNIEIVGEYDYTSLMLFVEDALQLIAENYHQTNAFGGALAGDWYESFVQDVAYRVIGGQALSTEQGKMILKLVIKSASYLVKSGYTTQHSITDLLTTPQYRQPPYQSTKMRNEVRYMGANFLAFRFKYNDLIMADLREMITMNKERGITPPHFDRTHRLWIVSIAEEAVLLAVREIIAHYKFEMDIPVRNYLALCHCSLNKTSTMVYDDESNTIVGNVCDNNLFAMWIKHVVPAGDYL